MVKVGLVPLDNIAKKFVDVTPARAPYYEAGILNPTVDWATAASAAAPTYKAAVSNPAIDKLYAGGVKRAGTAKWQRKAKDVGVSRYGPGVTAALEDYKSGFAPYYEELSKVEIPAKKPRGDPSNYDRVKAIGDALHKKRLALAAVG